MSSNIARLLEAVRQRLGMDVAYITEIVGDRHIFGHVEANETDSLINRGRWALPEIIDCLKIAEDCLVHDAETPNTQAVHDLPIGSHLDVPFRLSNYRIFGSFGCLSFAANPTPISYELTTLRTFADLIAQHVDNDPIDVRNRTKRLERVGSVIDEGGPSMVYQPVFRLVDRSIEGVEALARFKQAPIRSPDRWFADAAEVGLQGQLELQAIANALDGFKALWERTSLTLNLNVSPRTITEFDVLGILDGHPIHRCILEITEHEHVDDYSALNAALAPLRRRGARIAVDDAGAGYASMRHILNLHPDIIKLDVSLTSGIHVDRIKRALAASLVTFGSEVGSLIIAEGIETQDELTSLIDIGVHAGQGYHLARPASIETLESLI